MPRKARIYWIQNPKDLMKCRSRRCELPAVRSFLCGDHYGTWQANAYQPPMPESYSGRAVKPEESPLRQQLREKKETYATALNEIAARDIEDVEQLREDIETLRRESETLAKERASQLEPLERTVKRVDSWFSDAEQKLSEAVQLAEAKLRRATIPPPGKKRTG